MSSPVRLVREALAGALVPLGVEVYDTLPDAAEVPAAVVGIPAIRAEGSISGLVVFSTTVTLVAERADFHDAQVRLDDLVWSAYLALRSLRLEGFSSWTVGGAPRPLEVAGHTHPAYELSVDSTLPC